MHAFKSYTSPHIPLKKFTQAWHYMRSALCLPWSPERATAAEAAPAAVKLGTEDSAAACDEDAEEPALYLEIELK